MDNQKIEKLKKIASDIAANKGYEIVDLTYTYGKKHDLLSILVFRKEGIDLDDCANISREVEAIYDELDFLKRPYYLEISSPGLDRPIKTKDDYRRNLNNDVDVHLYAPIDGSKKFSGKLVNYDDDNIYLKFEDEEISIPIKSISKMQQSIVF